MCSAYGLSEKHSTSTLLTFGNQIVTSNLKSMDFLVIKGHVVLYSSTSGNYYYIYDASTATGKVAYRKMPISNYSGYIARTPWQTSCTFPSSYSYNTTSHWKACSDCGYKIALAHSFVTCSTYRKCSVCGYKTTEANTIK